MIIRSFSQDFSLQWVHWQWVATTCSPHIKKLIFQSDTWNPKSTVITSLIPFFFITLHGLSTDRHLGMLPTSSLPVIIMTMQVYNHEHRQQTFTWHTRRVINTGASCTCIVWINDHVLSTGRQLNYTVTWYWASSGQDIVYTLYSCTRGHRTIRCGNLISNIDDLVLGR